MRCLSLAGFLLLLTCTARAADPPPPSLQELIGRLSDRDVKVRGRAARDLGNLGLAARSAVPALARCLHDPRIEVRDRASKALAQIGVPAVPELIRALSDRDAGIRNRAARALAVIGPDAKAAVPALMAALKDRQPEVRMASIVALGEIGEAAKEAAPKLVHLFHDRNARVRELAGGSLQMMGSAAIGPVCELLEDADTKVRLQAIHTLALFGSDAKRAVPGLRRALRDKDHHIRSAAAAALGNMGVDARDAAPELLEALCDKKQDAREAAANSLILLMVDGVPGLLEKIREVESKGVWGRHLVRANVPEVKDPLTRLLTQLLDKDPTVRGRAALGLGNLGQQAQRAIPPLRRALTDDSAEVRLCVSVALARIDRINNEADLARREAVHNMLRLQRALAAQARMRVGLAEAALNAPGLSSPDVQQQMFQFMMMYISYHTERSQPAPAAMEHVFSALGPEAIPALVKCINMVQSLNIGGL